MSEKVRNKSKGFDPKNGLIQREALTGLLVAQAICIAPLMFVLAPWVVVVWLFALVYRIQILRGKWPFPSVVLKTIVGALCVSGVFITYSGIAGVEPMVAFLVCSFVLKLLEVKYRKDAYVILFICFVAIAAQFLFSQHILSTLYGCASLVGIIAAWQAVFYARNVTVMQHLFRSGGLVLQSMPFMLLLFLVMPRLGPLWAVPMPEGQASTGFGETMSPGDIGNLVKSGKPAFRVSFYNRVPPTSEMYWRGLVLDHFDGRVWRANQSNLAKEERRRRHSLPAKISDGEMLAYSVILEPHNQRWLFSLGVPVTAESTSIDVKIESTDTLVAEQNVISKAQYNVVAALKHKPKSDQLSALEQAVNLQLPPGYNPRSVALAKFWQEKNKSTFQIMNEALGLFNNQFTYTLKPALLGKNSVDDFLFGTKTGFCEHFASSFVFLMRAAGVPARVVIGYQGGTDYGTQDYYTVKQSDAHAWTEIWVDGMGWMVVDPTAAVAPNRIDLGVEQALGEEDRKLISQGVWHGSVLTKVYRAWDAAGYNWNRWVLNYDSRIQESLMTQILGAYEPLRIALAFTAICALIFCCFFVFIIYQRKSAKRAIEVIYAMRVVKKYNDMGFERPPNATFEAMAERAKQKEPRMARALLGLHASYEKLRYAGKSSALQEFILRCKKFPAEL